MSNVTPFVKRMRTVGGTIYVFSSATEDIGLNIAERNNVVKMSNYALLNIPDIVAPSTPSENKFNVLGIAGAFSSFGSANIKDGGVLLAESFQNYALNLEANLTSLDTYDSKLPTTVTERVFWKWLKETGAIRWGASDKPGYWSEPIDSSLYSSVVQSIGEITAGAIRYDGYGSYNETYVLIPSSYGKSNVYFKQVPDVNYNFGMSITSGNTNILGRENYTIPHPDALDYKAYYDVASSDTSIGSYGLTCDGVAGWWTTNEGISFAPNSYHTDVSSYAGYTDSSLSNTLKYYDGNTSHTVEFKRSKGDCMSIEYNIKSLYNDDSITFDDISTKPLSIGEEYDFNAILIYYSVYASKTSVSPTSTNLLGVLFLDNAVGKTSSVKITDPIVISSTKKIQGGNSVYGSTGFGTSYSFRVNIKTDNMFDDTTAEIFDSSSSNTILEDFQGVLGALEQSVNILNKQTSTINFISNQYIDMEARQSSFENQVESLKYDINNVSDSLTKTDNYLLTNSVIIPGDVSVYIPIGNKNIDRSIKIAYTSVKNTTYREGELRILNDGTNLYVVESYQENNAPPYTNLSKINISAIYTDNSINLIINASTGASSTFSYAPVHKIKI